MRLLIDTHILLEAFDGRLRSGRAFDAIARAEHLFVSHASLWEIEIKKALGKLRTSDDFYVLLEKGNFTLLPITVDHIRNIPSLPRHHGDPFDRMLISQAQIEGLTIITQDKEFSSYNVALL